MTWTCITCGGSFDKDGFYWFAYTTNQGKRSIRHDSRCKECARVRRRRRYAGNPARDNAVSRKYKARNAERVSIAATAYRQNLVGRSKRCALQRRRGAAKLKRTPPWASGKAIEVLYRIAALLTKRTGVEWHVDHEMPLQGRLVSGLHVENNLRVIRGSENQTKHNKFQVAA